MYSKIALFDVYMLFDIKSSVFICYMYMWTDSIYAGSGGLLAQPS